MVHILTSNGNVLSVEVRPQESRSGDSATTANLALPLKRVLTKEVFAEQQSYLNTASMAAYVSLNKRDQANRFKASVNLKSQSENGLNFIKGSTSSGLGFTIALFNAYWAIVLKKGKGVIAPVFATGEVNKNGELESIGHIETKINSVLEFVTRNGIPEFTICMPKANKEELSEKTIYSIQNHGGQIVAKSTVQESLLALLGEEYDGDPLGRWEPFKGLESFEYRDSIRFFGRQKDVERLYADFSSNNGFLIVSGPTGAGKSSLVKAGLIPYLTQKNHCDGWISSTPTELDKSGLLEEVITLFSKGQEVGQQRKKEIEAVIRNQNSDEIKKVLSDLHVFNQSYVIHIDQFEETFTILGSTSKVLEDLKLLNGVLRLSNDIKIILSIRNEYLPNLLDLGLIQSPVISNVSSILSPQSWSEIVSQQASVSDINFESNNDVSLEQSIIDQAIKIPNALSLVQFVLKQLYDSAQLEQENKNTLRLKHFNQMGGIVGAISNRAEEAIEATQASVDTINEMFSLFVNVNGDGLPYSKSIEWLEENQFSQELNQLVIDLYKANIFLREKNEKGIDTYRFAHESLFASWPRLKRWISDQKEFLIWKNSIDRSFQNWLKSSSQDQKKFLISDRHILIDSRSFQRQGLINDSRLQNFIKNSYIEVKNQRYFNVLSLSFLILLIVSVFPYFTYEPSKVEINTLTCLTGGDPIETLEIYVLHKGQAETLKEKFCHNKNTEISNEYGQIKFYWKQPESYNMAKLFTGKLAIIQSSDSNLGQSSIISNPALYTPIAKYPDYYSCLYSLKDTKTPVLTKEYFEGKTLGLSNKVYSQSSYQVPLMELSKIGVYPPMIKHPNTASMQSSLESKEIDLIAKFCPYSKKDELEAEKSFNYLKLDKKLEGTTWYVSNKVKLKSIKCIVQSYLMDSAEATKKNEEDGPDSYFANIKILNQEDCTDE